MTIREQAIRLREYAANSNDTSEAVVTADQITEAQRRLGPSSLSLTFWERWARIHSKDKRRPVHARRELRRRARWWELEAMRGYPSSERSRQYAANLRWLVELMDNGHRVAGVTFEGLVRLHGSFVLATSDALRHGQRSCGCLPLAGLDDGAQAPDRLHHDRDRKRRRPAGRGRGA